MSLAFDQIKEELKLKDYNLWLLIDDNNDEQLEQKVIETTRLENIKNYTISKYDNCYITNSKYSDEYKEFMNGTSAKEEDIFDSNINVKTVNNEQYKEYIKKLGLNYEKMKNKAILINNIRVGKYDEEKNKYIQKNIKMFEYKENETINCKTSDDKQFDVEIGIITDILPFGLEEPSNYALMIVSNDIYEKYNIDNLQLSKNRKILLELIKKANIEHNVSLRMIEQETGISREKLRKIKRGE